MRRWLPRHYEGPRRLEDVCFDLLVIAAAGTLSEAHVTVSERGGGRLWHRTGALEAVPSEIAPWTLQCGVEGGEETFTVSPDSFEEAYLHTFDGADYYTLTLYLTDVEVVIRDAYNGL